MGICFFACLDLLPPGKGHSLSRPLPQPLFTLSLAVRVPEATLSDLLSAGAIIQPHITAMVLPQAPLSHLPCPGTDTVTYPFDVTEDKDKEDPEENSDNPSPNQDDNLHIGPVIRACGIRRKS